MVLQQPVPVPVNWYFSYVEIIQKGMGAPMCVFFSPTEGNSFRGFLFNAIAVMVHLDWEFALVGKNLLQEKQILFFESRLLLEGRKILGAR